MAQEDSTSAPGMKQQTAKQVVRLESLLRQTQSMLRWLEAERQSSPGDLTDAEIQICVKLTSEIGAGLEQLSGAFGRAGDVLKAQSVVFRFNDDQKAVLGRLAGGDEVLWMQSGAALDSLAKRGLVRVSHDAKQRAIAVLTDAGREVVKDWKE